MNARIRVSYKCLRIVLNSLLRILANEDIISYRIFLVGAVAVAEKLLIYSLAVEYLILGGCGRR